MFSPENENTESKIQALDYDSKALFEQVFIT